MKRLALGLLVLTLVMAFTATGHTANFFQDDQTIRFFVVNFFDTGGVQVTLDIINLTGDVVQYWSPSATAWVDAGTTVTFTSADGVTGVPGSKLLTSWQLKGPPTDPVGDLTFSGGLVGGINDVYPSLLIDFDETPGGTNLAFYTAEGVDRMSPVPIPPSALLLGSGILGLLALGFRRRQEY